MNKIFEKASDLHVRAIVAYVGSNKVYAEAAKTTELKAAQLEDMFNKGLILVDTGVFYRPISLSINAGTGAATVTYVKADASTATTAVLATATCSK